MDDLTKDQKFLLTSLYKEYLSHKQASDPDAANYFVDSDSLIPLLGLSFSQDHVADICLALLEKGYLFGCKDEDSVSELKISDKTLVYMENQFKNNVKAVVDFLAKFKPF